MASNSHRHPNNPGRLNDRLNLHPERFERLDSDRLNRNNPLPHPSPRNHYSSCSSSRISLQTPPHRSRKCQPRSSRSSPPSSNRRHPSELPQACQGWDTPHTTMTYRPRSKRSRPSISQIHNGTHSSRIKRHRWTPPSRHPWNSNQRQGRPLPNREPHHPHHSNPHHSNPHHSNPHHSHPHSHHSHQHSRDPYPPRSYYDNPHVYRQDASRQDFSREEFRQDRPELPPTRSPNFVAVRRRWTPEHAAPSQQFLRNGYRDGRQMDGRRINRREMDGGFHDRFNAMPRQSDHIADEWHLQTSRRPSESSICVRYRCRRSRRPSRWYPEHRRAEARRVEERRVEDRRPWGGHARREEGRNGQQRRPERSEEYGRHHRERPFGKIDGRRSYEVRKTGRSPTMVSLTTESSRKEKKEDEIVHFAWRHGMQLGTRYVVVSQLGEGTFGRVFKCLDLVRDVHVAVKVVRGISRYTHAAKIEAEILERVRHADPEGQSNCMMLHERFLFDEERRRVCRSASVKKRRRGESRRREKRDGSLRGRNRSSSSSSDEFQSNVHMCLVSEVLGLSLYAFLSQNNYRGFFLEDIRTIAQDVLKALAFLRKIKLTHTDLKPENILFVENGARRVPLPRSSYHPRFWEGIESGSDDSTASSPPLSRRSPVNTGRPYNCHVKLIDFGGATLEGDSHCSLVNTRQYRAPEVILQIGWDCRSDLWCLGCILMELYTGVLLFKTHEHLEHLALMERIVGPIPHSVLEKASRSEGLKYLSPDNRSLRLDWPEGTSSRKSLAKVTRSRPLEDLVVPCHRIFSDFVRSLLKIDPDQRPSPLEALRHPFFSSPLTEW